MMGVNKGLRFMFHRFVVPCVWVALGRAGLTPGPAGWRSGVAGRRTETLPGFLCHVWSAAPRRSLPPPARSCAAGGLGAPRTSGLSVPPGRVPRGRVGCITDTQSLSVPPWRSRRWRWPAGHERRESRHRSAWRLSSPLPSRFCRPQRNRSSRPVTTARVMTVNGITYPSIAVRNPGTASCAWAARIKCAM